jgi:hypothetical protein
LFFVFWVFLLLGQNHKRIPGLWELSVVQKLNQGGFQKDSEGGDV